MIEYWSEICLRRDPMGVRLCHIQPDKGPSSSLETALLLMSQTKSFAAVSRNKLTNAVTVGDQDSRTKTRGPSDNVSALHYMMHLKVKEAADAGSIPSGRDVTNSYVTTSGFDGGCMSWLPIRSRLVLVSRGVSMIGRYMILTVQPRRL